MKNLINMFRKQYALAMVGPMDNEHSQDQHQNEHHQSAEKYQCPMRCEGDKVYEKPGNCPVCNMKLVPVNDKKQHHGHQHHCC